MVMKRVRNVISSFLAQQQIHRVPVRILGKTGLAVKAIGLGGQSLLEIEGQQKAAYDLINKALDLGINYFDTATIYGPSREYLGKTLRERRNNIVLASKVYKRSYSEAKKELDESLKLLNTPYIDILQLHAIQDDKDLRVFQKDGAARLIVEAKLAGIVRNIGITGHYDPDILIKFMNIMDFDTVLMSCNPAVPEFDKAVQVARSKNMGVIAMKVMSRGILPMYFPSSDLLHYAMHRSHVAIVGCTAESDLQENVCNAALYDPKVQKDFPISDEIRRRSAYFFKGYENEKWPSTYQPYFPIIQYEK